MFFEKMYIIMPSLLRGTVPLLQLFALTVLMAIPLGLPFALGSISKFPPFKILSRVYIWIFRGTPLLLQLYFFCYGLPILLKPIYPTFGRDFSRFTAAVVTFVLNYSAYFAEIYRAGIQSIDKGQYEAAKALGFSPLQTMRLIIIPQTIKRIIPPASNEIITLVKDTALVTAVAVPELLKAAKDYVNREVDTTAYFFAAMIYLTLTFVLTVISQRLEKRFSRHEEETV